MKVKEALRKITYNGDGEVVLLIRHESGKHTRSHYTMDAFRDQSRRKIPFPYEEETLRGMWMEKGNLIVYAYDTGRGIYES